MQTHFAYQYNPQTLSGSTKFTTAATWRTFLNYGQFRGRSPFNETFYDTLTTRWNCPSWFNCKPTGEARNENKRGTEEEGKKLQNEKNKREGKKAKRLSKFAKPVVKCVHWPGKISYDAANANKSSAAHSK